MDGSLIIQSARISRRVAEKKIDINAQLMEIQNAETRILSVMLPHTYTRVLQARSVYVIVYYKSRCVCVRRRYAYDRANMRYRYLYLL